MHAKVEKTKANTIQSQSNATNARMSNGIQDLGVVDNRSEAISQKKLQSLIYDAGQTNESLQLRGWRIFNAAPKSQGNQYSVQRIKIKLKDEDPILMERLRNVPMVNQGGQNLNDPSGANTANLIGSTENIILEGHGYESTSIFSSKIVSQAGIAPSRLAAFVHSVHKPNDWSGNVVLAGCSTGDIAESVSMEYYQLAGKSVNVIGTKKNIRIGSKENGTNFIGSDWDSYPLSERPTDLSFVGEVEKATKDFWGGALKQLIVFAKEIRAFQKGQSTGITLSIAPIEQMASKMVTVETDSSSTKIPNKNYKLAERQQLYAFFTDAIAEIKKIDFFIYPNQVQQISNTNTAKTQVSSFVQKFLLLSKQDALYSEINYYLLGLKLKEINLFDPSQAIHRKKKRTKTSVFGDTWIDD